MVIAGAAYAYDTSKHFGIRRIILPLDGDKTLGKTHPRLLKPYKLIPERILKFQ